MTTAIKRIDGAVPAATTEETLPDARSSAASVVALRARSLRKEFGPVVAIADCSLELHRGEVHALLGENGSGKSTLTKILTGIHIQTTGAFELGGEAASFKNPAEARNAGIVAVYQDILVSPRLSVLDNVWLGTDGIFRRKVSRREKVRIASGLLTRLLGREVALGQPVAELSLSDRQAVCIVRALVQPFDVLVLDEATSSLDLDTRNRLFVMLRELTVEGKAILFVSHRMDEIDEIADRLTVMRSGRTVASIRAGEASVDELLVMLTGHEPTVAAIVDRDLDRGPRSVHVRDLHLGVDTPAIDLDIHVGEITALAGLEGHGQDAFLQALWGTRAGDVRVRVDGQDHRITTPRGGHKVGVAYVPRDRREESTLARLSIRANFEIATLNQDTRAGIIRPPRTQKRFLEFADRLKLRYGKASDALSTLSGGNQQKVVLARWLATHPRVLLLNDPTRGVDIGTKREIYALLRELRDRGTTVVMLSSEIDEIVEVADRVLVFRNQGVAADLTGADRITRDGIVGAYFGMEADR